MSWCASLTDDRGHCEGDWGHTHNTNRMIAAALESIGCVNAHEIGSDHPLHVAIGPPWWERLDGCTGPEGAALLHEIVMALEKDPDRFRAMNPENGWGSYDSLLVVLRDMRDRVPEWPTTWSTSG